MTHTMNAIRFHTYGGPEVLVTEQVAKPSPGKGQLLVRIHAASVNPIDWKLRQGLLKDLAPLRLPIISGQDLAGTVEAVGEDVRGLRPGDEVFGMTAMPDGGAYAEYAVLDEAAVARKPRSLDMVQAASIPMGALTAWQGVVEAGGLKAGDRVFVHAGAGNVGGMAVQIAHALGAHVTAGASARSRELVGRYGADRVVDYGSERFEDVVRDQDIVFDTIAGDMQARSWGLLKPGGILVSALGVADPSQAAARGVRATGMGCVPNGEQLRRVAELVDGDKIRSNVATVLALAHAAEAQELSRKGGVKGKIVLTVA